MKLKYLKSALTLVLLIGSAIAWTTVTLAYKAFFLAGGQLLQLTGCKVANPITTPCLYGAIAFLIALIWSVQLWNSQAAKSYVYLGWLLVASTLFGWGNVAYELYNLYLHGKIVGCTNQVVTSVYQSSCLYGTIAFTLALIISFWIYKKLIKERN